MIYRNAVEAALILSGKYNLPRKFLTVTGLDAYGQEMTEEIPAIDHARLNADIAEIMAGRKPSPVREISCIVCES
jgi:hypothetical protein